VNLVIDQGNSINKIAVFEKENIVFTSEVINNLQKELNILINKFTIDKVIFSTVLDRSEKIESFLKERIPYQVFLSEKTLLPINVIYRTPETLGKDRLAGVIGANYLHSERDILVIDAGTALTFDFINKEGNYYGGNISPGLTMRLRALNHYTAKLPLILADGEIPSIGFSTETAIRSGVISGIIYEIDGYIDYFKNKYENLFVFLTGGDTFFLAEKLKNSIFADTKLLIKGLNRILNYNAKL